MSFFSEIKTLFTAEIEKTPQYLIGLKIKNLIIQDILTPTVNYNFTYTLVDEDFIDLNNKIYETNIIKLSLKLILGFEPEFFGDMIIINMKLFLE